MKFLELMERLRGRGVKVGVVRDGRTKKPTPWSDGSGGNNPDIFGVCDDSRKVKAGDLFVARGGTKVDGAKYVADAVKRGAAAVVSELAVDCPGIGSAEVDDPNLACAILAHEVAGNPTSGMKVIGITGTKGKTTVAYLLRSVLKAAGFKVGMIGTVEIDDGAKVVPAEMTTPGSVELVELFSRMKANGVTHCVMEVSSHALHQRRVAGIEFAVGIFTNLTGDHLDYHGTMEEYAAAKAILFEGLGEGAVAVVNGDDKWVGRMVEGCHAKVMRYRVGNPILAGEVTLYIWEMASAGLRFQLWRADGMDSEFESPLVGKHNAYNLASVFAASEALGLGAGGYFERGAFYKVIEECKGAPGRLQGVVHPGIYRNEMPFQVFVDYAHTHDALENVLSALRVTMGRDSGAPPASGPPKGGTPNGRLICVFGCGGDRDRTKRPKMGAVAERLADVVIVTSDNPRTESAAAIIEEICVGFSAGWRERSCRPEARTTMEGGACITVELDRRVAIQKAIGMAAAGDVVLIAGKGHENYQIIGTVKQHFDDVEETENALRALKINHDDTTTRRVKT